MNPAAINQIKKETEHHLAILERLKGDIDRIDLCKDILWWCRLLQSPNTANDMDHLFKLYRELFPLDTK